MDKELKLLLDNSKLDQLYKHNLFSIKSICEFLGVWDNYSSEDKFKLENFTKRDTDINKHFTYKGNYNKNFTYGEILRNGVDEIINKINRYKKISDKDVFMDIGCGCGKLILHTAIKSDIKTFVGIEIVPQRLRYAKYIKEEVLPEHKSIFFIEKDIKNFDLSIATVVFMNDVCFDYDMRSDIFNRLPKGCHFITSYENKSCKILKEEFVVDVSWGNKLKLYYYIK
jgi:2-polyprenyl-3-methyl-5-hydroxy-6-metoxy-1,4-benzoquinol methylase